MGRSDNASPTAGRRQLMAGLAAQKAGKLDAAAAHYEAVLKREPANADALHLLGLLMNERRQYRQAETLIRRAIAVNDAVAGYHNNLGNVLASLGRNPEALAEYRRAIELEPGDAAAYNNLGNALRAEGKLAEAERSQRRAVELDPQHAEAWNNLGIALTKQ